MALNIAVRVGDAVFVDDRKITVISAYEPEKATIRTDQNVEVELTGDKTVEVFPNVFMGIGKKFGYGEASLVFEAPKHIIIQREDWRRKNGIEGAVCVLP